MIVENGNTMVELLSCSEHPNALETATVYCLSADGDTRIVEGAELSVDWDNRYWCAINGAFYPIYEGWLVRMNKPFTLVDVNSLGCDPIYYLVSGL